MPVAQSMGALFGGHGAVSVIALLWVYGESKENQGVQVSKQLKERMV